jgi:long-chain fatty acid transport protein
MRSFRTVMLFLAVVVVLALSADKGYAQGINYPVGNPTATSGTGNARTDPDNLFIRNNIAGLTEIPVSEEEENTGTLGDSGKGKWRATSELQFSVYRYRRERILPAPGLTSRATIFNPGFAGEITYTSGDHKYGFAIGAYQLFGFQAKIEDDPVRFGRFATFFDTKVASNDLAFGGAVRLNKAFSVGGSFIFGRAFLDLKAPTAALAAVGIIQQSRVDIDDIGGPGASVGILFHPIEKFSLGINYKSRRRYTLEGDLETAVLVAGRVIPLTRQARAKFELPTVIEAGIQVKPTNKLLLAFDFRFYDYTEVLQTVSLFDKQTGSPLLVQRVDAEDVRSVRFGLVYSVSDKTKVHFGSAFTSNGFPGGVVNPGLINIGGVDISGGFGKKVFGHWLNVGAAAIFGRDRKLVPPENRTFPGKYDGGGFLVGVGIRL